MKKIYKVNDCNAEGMGKAWVKSRITMACPLLTLVMILMLGAWSVPALGQTYDNGTWYSLYASGEVGASDLETDKNTDFPVYSPSTGKLSFQWKKSGKFIGYAIYTLKISESKDGSTFINEKTVVNSGATSRYGHNSYQTVNNASVGTEIVQLRFNQEGSLKRYFKEVKLPMATHIRLKTTSTKNNANLYGIVDQNFEAFADTYWGTTCASFQTVKLRSFLTTNSDDKITITSSNPTIFRVGTADNTGNKIFTVGKNKFACESYSSVSGALNVQDYSFKVYFCPPGVGDYSADITISNGSNSAVVHVSGKGIKRNQTIQNFSTTAETHWTSDAITAFAAYTTDNTSNQANNLTITYTSSNTQIATVAANGAVTIKKGGNNNDTQVTLRATQAGNDWYNSTYKEVTYTINKVTPAVTWPTILTGLKYNETCPINTKVEDKWTGGSAVDNKQNPTLDVDGSFTCAEKLVPAKNTTGYTATFTPDNTNWYNPISEKIYGTVEKGDQTITWDLLDGQNARGQWYEYATGETFDAESKAKANDALTGLKVNYSSSNSAFATITDGNKLNVVKSNEVVTITATCVDPAGNWNDAVSVTKTFKTCGAKPDNWNDVSATGLVYGQLLEESTLSGVVKLGEVTVPGTLEWVAPTTLPNAGNHNYSVLFTPENEDAYGSVTFEVPVTVDKADPVIIWNIGARLRENTRYSNFVVSTNTEAALNISVSNSTLLSIEGNVLTTGAVTGTTNGWIKVSQPASANYNAVPEQTFTVTINPKSNVCLPFTLNETIYNNAKENSEGKVYWCTTNENGNRDNYIGLYDVTYTQRVGIALGSWEDGLSGISAKKIWDLIRGEGSFSWTTKYVDLSFTGVPDKISFDVESQKVTSTWPEVTWKASATDWYLYESADGVNYTQVGDKFVSGHQVRNRQLKEETRYVRIQYSGNFTGFVKNLQITQKKYLNVDKPTLTFGTEANPLQEPQTIKLSYASLGYCGDQNSKITVTSNNPAFYVDESEITENVDIDQMGEYTIRVRCNDVNQSGKIVFEAYDGTTLEVPVSSAKPVLTASSPVIFKTGTEHAPAPETLYRTLDEIGYAGCFEGAEAKFDTLYIYGVSESAASSRAWEFDASKGYNVPAIAAGNLHTPCFVYAKNGSQYDYKRTYDATTTSLNIQAAGKKLGFIGYKPAGTAAFNAIQLNGAANEQTEVYLNNAEIGVNGSALVVNNTEAAEDAFAVKVYARGTNILQANAAAVQLSANKAQLTVEDSWKAGDASALLAFRPGTGKPSIDLGSAKGKVIVNGTKLELHNATNMAIAHMDGTTEMTDGEVKINDGTILGDAILGLPHKTLIDGGTFNAGDIKVYKTSEKVVRALNSRNEVLGRQTTTEDQLPEWYGKAHLTLDGDKVHPMLFGGEGLCVFDNSQNDHQSNNDDNWTEKPTSTSDAIITENMDITGSLTVKSLTINPGVTVIVKENATLSVGDGDSYMENAGNLHVENGGKVVLKDGELRVNDFILEASIGDMSRPASSGQVNGEETNLKVRGDSYFQICFDPVAISYGWYDFVLPFDVDVVGGIYLASDLNTPLVNNVDFAIMEFSEAKRAQNTKPWTWFSGTLKAGKLYTITLDETKPSRTTYVFKKKANAEMGAANTYNTICTTSAPATDRGWNGMGNGTLRYCQLNSDELPENAKMQIYDHTNDCYIPCEATQYTYAIGTAFFIQVQENNQTITLDTVSDSRAFRAPSRDMRTVDEFRLALTAENATYAADHLWVSASEEATGEYVIGRDLLKMGTPTSAKVAQMWTVNNGLNLCDIEMPLVGNNASTPLNLYAPQAGTYEIAVEKSPEDASLYLTKNDRVIWNLSMSPYELDLTKGTTEGYGLRIVADRQTTTDIENAVFNDQNSDIKKVLIDDQIYIVMPDGRMYDAAGRCVSE